ncbi:unnamed protein product [Ostreobium quekettii]|uniref:Tyr recombinase domain-containing protein n=1 Tax=Ostreobium quekettii TaxID=121088 RepID=A0A8S1IU58_9CHLO|nr:unnamed protein product [Ostreobium quekettii]
MGSPPAKSHPYGDLRAVRELMIEAGLCRGVVNQNVGRIVRAFRWAASEELVSAEIWSGLRALPGLKAGRTRAHERPSVQPVADELVDATLLELSPTVRAMVELQRSTGMRPAEVCSVRPVDVDRSGDVWVFHPVEHKTQHHGKERSVFIGPRGQEVLRPFLSRAVEEYCFRPTRAASIVKAARRYRVDSYRRAIQRACERAGVERWSPNQLRHSFATRARAAYGLEAAQVLLGHSCARITEVYAERDAAKGIAAAKAIG